MKPIRKAEKAAPEFALFRPGSHDAPAGTFKESGS